MYYPITFVDTMYFLERGTLREQEGFSNSFSKELRDLWRYIKGLENTCNTLNFVIYILIGEQIGKHLDKK